MQGQYRFLRRLWKAVYDHVRRRPAAASVRSWGPLQGAAADLRRLTHQTLAKVSDDIGRRRVFNTAIAAVMELLNAVARYEEPGEMARARAPGGAGDRGAVPVAHRAACLPRAVASRSATSGR